MQPEIVSVVIRVRNAARDLRTCLGLLAEQELPRGTTLEIIVVDNESTDGSREIPVGCGATVVPISTREFTWGRALNRGIEKAKGLFVVLLSADAHPGNNKWLRQILTPFEDPSIAAVFGRQLPRSDAPIDEVIRITGSFGQVSQVVDQTNISGNKAVISNACAAIRRQVWKAVPYDETIRAAEDRVWMETVLKLGYRYAYQADALVYHSHKDRVFRHAYREWELFLKYSKQMRHSSEIIAFCHALGGLVKRRLCNCFTSRIVFRTRMEGLVRLPLEVFAFIIIGICETIGIRKNSLRFSIWG